MVLIFADGIPNYPLCGLAVFDLPDALQQLVSLAGENVDPMDMFFHLDLNRVNFSVFWPPVVESTQDSITMPSSRVLANVLAEYPTVSDSWQLDYDEDRVITCVKRSSATGNSVQVLTVNGQLRRAIFDQTGDGRIDYGLLNANRDDLCEAKVAFKPPFVMLDWVLSPSAQPHHGIELDFDALQEAAGGTFRKKGVTGVGP